MCFADRSRMSSREIEVAAPLSPVVFHGRPNWTAVGFFAGLAFLHIALATLAFMQSRWEGFLSVLLGVTFVLVTLASYLSTFELTVLPADRRLRLRTGWRRLCFERFVPFKQVRNVRLTQSLGGNALQIICALEEIDCPPTDIPRQEALYLAMIIGVELVKVIEEDGTSRLERVHAGQSAKIP